jgi:hypothetical protein
MVPAKGQFAVGPALVFADPSPGAGKVQQWQRWRIAGRKAPAIAIEARARSKARRDGPDAVNAAAPCLMI